MKESERNLAERLAEGFSNFETDSGALPGLIQIGRRDTLVRQIVDSDRRNRYVAYLLGSDLGASRTDPRSTYFDPLKASIIHTRNGDTDEAFWMVFLFVHFGRHARGGWRYAAEVYGGAGPEQVWTWTCIVGDVEGFRDWIADNAERIQLGSPRCGFGNHRKYERLANTGQTISTYVEWVGASHHHLDRFDDAIEHSADGADAFDALFRSLSGVRRFGRTAKFDYLTMIDRLGLSEIHPGRAYIGGSTGPLRGARLLFDSPSAQPSSPHALDIKVIELQAYLQVGFESIEDALCNWQKSPATFRPFRG
jgi:hypothetical protein